MHDAYDDFVMHDAQHERWLAQLPVCEICGMPIQDDYYYVIDDTIICCDCLGEYLKDHDYRVENKYL